MKAMDRFLAGIVIGVLALVASALALALLRPAPSYLPDDTPEAVAHNYLLALRQGDEGRAYGYLASELAGRPRTLDEFSRDLRAFSWRPGGPEESSSVTIEPARLEGGRATVRVRETVFYPSGLFSSEYTNTFSMRLRQEQGGWRIVASDAYWAACWQDIQGCR